MWKEGIVLFFSSMHLFFHQFLLMPHAFYMSFFLVCFGSLRNINLWNILLSFFKVIIWYHAKDNFWKLPTWKKSHAFYEPLVLFQTVTSVTISYLLILLCKVKVKVVLCLPLLSDSMGNTSCRRSLLKAFPEMQKTEFNTYLHSLKWFTQGNRSYWTLVKYEHSFTHCSIEF